MAISIFHFFLFLTLIERLESSAVAPASAAGQDDDDCARISSCSHNGPTIRFPFRLVNYSQRCGGYPVGFELSCNDKKQTVLDLPSSVQVLVEKIDYKSQQIQVSAPDGGCLIGRFPNLVNLSASPFRFSSELESLGDYALYNCSPPARDSGGDPVVVPCLGVDGYRVYAVWANSDVAFNLQLASCVKIHNIGSVPYDIFGNYGSLNWAKPNCSRCEANGRFCRWSNTTVPEPGIVCFDEPKIPKDTSTQLQVAGIISGSFLILLSFLIIGYVYCSNKIERENQAKIERFLEDYRALRPSRYSHADIKRITHQFKDELGRGGYGTVYKGMLSNDTFVAVKVLDNSSNENGEDFINEVGTIGKIHHVNVVRLVGFCADGFTRALVYEFLPNESLEKYIFSDNQKNHPLGWEKLQDIALGIAKGIEYLHQGCDQRILHFDIKPQNILLDQNFNPKISDFGLAKLCSKEQSAVSMTAARGTMGYIAPEVLSRNFGKASCKSDVYSYGMLLLEMVGGRKNVDVTVGNTSQMYFPEWVYKCLERGEELRIRIQEDGDASIARKLTIVGLRGIQWNPADRPSMKVVIQMLEGNTESLEMPPNPFATTNSIRPKRLLQQELAVISELE